MSKTVGDNSSGFMGARDALSNQDFVALMGSLFPPSK
jgi:hypothetical protein